MPNTMVSPTAYFGTRVYNLLLSLLQQLAATGQITEPVRQFIINEYNSSASGLVQQIWNKCSTYGTLAQEPSDNSIKQHLNNFINQAIANFGQRMNTQYNLPLYQNGYPGGYLMNRYPQYNPGLANGIQPNQVSIFTPSIQQQPMPQACYANSLPTVPNPPPAPMPAPVPAPAVPPTPPTPPPASEPIRTGSYQPPTPIPNQTVTINDDVMVGKLEYFRDESTEGQIGAAKVTLARPVVSAHQAITRVLQQLNTQLPKDKYVGITYIKLITKDLPRDTNLVKALTKLKQLANEQMSETMGAYKYLSMLIDALGEFSCQINYQLGDILLAPINQAILHGALFDSNQLGQKCSFKMHSLPELRDHFDPNTNMLLQPLELRTAGGLNRLAELVTACIPDTIRNLELSDPNTPAGLSDYITIFGEEVIQGHRVAEIKELRERSARTSETGKKTREAEAALKAFNAIFDAISKRSVFRLNNTTVFYTNLVIPCQINTRRLSITYSTLCLSPQSQEVDCHIEFFLVQGLSSAKLSVTQLWMEPAPGVLLTYVVTGTVDHWYWLEPDRLN